MPRHRRENGVVILLVAVVLLFVVGAMAALAIDVVTLYTARSEAQLAADGAALAGARALANSGLTSTTAGPIAAAEALATTVATQDATRNEVGGRKLLPAEVVVTFNDGDTTFLTNPRVTVQTKRTDLPTFFARMFGNTALIVGASATAEAYNPSGTDALGVATTPVSPICVKPWLLPNMDPTSSATPPTTIFDPVTGAITNPALLTYRTAGPPTRLQARCIDCSVTPLPTPSPWQYYPGDPVTTFPPPTQALPTCAPALIKPYQESVAGCIQTPIACNSPANIDLSNYPTRNTEMTDAVNCLTHAHNNNGDEVDPAITPPPFQFLAGTDNPVTGAAGNDVMVSDSLVTVPVFDSGNGTVPPSNPVTIVGFVQLFLSPRGRANPANGFMRTEVVNMVGCGTGASGQPILGNGASPVAVRLVSPP